jgi:hypothetical protein
MEPGRLEPSLFSGVTYYDEGLREWAVLDRAGATAPLHTSPVAEADTFVIFDDSRCRCARGCIA